MSNAVEWERVSPKVFEDMIALLISRLNPDARRIDGTGGDGGRDVQIPTHRGPIIYEMKSFTGRVTPTRRRQIINSLSRASDNEPVEWNLVLPIDPTPAEDRWFEGATKIYPFVCRWYGRTWLDEKMAAYPDIPRYFLGGTNDEVVAILRELNQEAGALSRGVPDVVDRMRALSSRLNDLDPYYNFGISLDKDGAVGVTVWPKYTGADVDRPIKVETLFEFPNTKEGRAAEKAFRDTLDFGSPTTVKPEYVTRAQVSLPGGLTESFEGGQIRLTASEGMTWPAFNLQLRIVDKNGRTKAQLPFDAQTRNTGARGGDVEFKDRVGAITGRIRLNTEDKTMHVTFKYDAPANVMPSVLLPGLQFLDQYRPPNSTVLLFEGREAAPPVLIQSPVASELKPLLTVVQALDEIQRASGVYFPFPEELSQEDIKGILMARQLIAGETVRGTWNTMKVSVSVGALSSLEDTVDHRPRALMLEEEFAIHVGGQDIPLGYTRRIMPNAIVADWPDIAPDMPADATVEVRFRPGADDSVEMVLIRDEEKLAKAAGS